MEKRLKAHMLNLYAMVLADNEAQISELEALYKIGHDQFKLTNEEINDAVFNSDDAIYFPDTLAEKVQYLYNLATIAWADGKITEEEQALLKKYAEKFGFLEENLDAIVDFMLKQTDPKHLKTLEEVQEMING